LQARVVDSSSAGFTQAMDISCHSLMRLAKAAEPLMKDGGAILTMSYSSWLRWNKLAKWQGSVSGVRQR